MASFVVTTSLALSSLFVIPSTERYIFFLRGAMNRNIYNMYDFLTIAYVVVGYSPTDLNHLMINALAERANQTYVGIYEIVH